MKERGIFYYWGPLLFKIKLATKDIQALKKLGAEAKLKKIHVGKTLAGVIKKEFQINIKKYNEIVQPYFKVYFEAYKNWYGNEIIKLDVVSAWINYMKAGPQPFSNTSYTLTPDAGDFFIFPWSLTHYVRPFTCSETRVSIAANFKIDTKNKGKLFNV